MPYLQHMEGNLILLISPFVVIENSDLLSFLIIKFELTVVSPKSVLVYCLNLFSDLWLASLLWTLIFGIYIPHYLQNSLLNRVGDSYFKTIFDDASTLVCLTLTGWYCSGIFSLQAFIIHKSFPTILLSRQSCPSVPLKLAFISSELLDNFSRVWEPDLVFQCTYNLLDWYHLHS